MMHCVHFCRKWGGSMGALLFITKNNLKKKKGDVAVLFFLMALAAVLLYTSISVFSGMNSVLDQAYEKANTADYYFLAKDKAKEIKSILTSQKEVADYEATDCLYLLDGKYRKEDQKEKNQMAFIIGAAEDTRKFCTLAGFSETSIAYDEILLPYSLKDAGGFLEGDDFYFTIGGTEYHFWVRGFVEDPLFANSLNISIYSVYLNENRVEDLKKENQTAKTAEYVTHKVRLKKGESSMDFDNRMSRLLTEKLPELSNSYTLSLNWEAMKSGDGMMSWISMGIVFVFSMLLILVALIVIRFSIHNFMERNRKNIGILQAAGYTAKQLNLTTVLEMGIVCLFAVTAGILLGIAGSGLIGKFEGMIMGLSWNRSLDGTGVILTVSIIFITVLGTAWMCGRSYGKVPVLASLRGGIHTHNFKKNYFAFETSRLPKNLILAAKNLLCEKGKSFSIFCIVALLAFSSAIGFGLYENFAMSTDVILKMSGSETGNVCISGEGLEKVGQQMEEWKEVEKILYYGNGYVRVESQEGEMEVISDTWKDPELVQNEMVVRGRLPKHENEIMLTTAVAKTLKADVGDTIYVTGKGERLSYIISGIDQKMNNMGLKAMMSEKGGIRLNGSNPVLALYVYTKDGITYKNISEKVLKKFPNVSTIDSETQVEGIMAGVSSSMVAICAIFVLITIFVVTMVEILLIRSKVIKEQRNLGLNKAIGFTTGQLIGQTMMMNMPVIFLGSVFGALLSKVAMGPMVVLCLSYCGIEKCDFTVHPFWVVLTIVGILAVAVVASFISAVKIRKIEPVKMLMEE